LKPLTLAGTLEQQGEERHAKTWGRR